MKIESGNVLARWSGKVERATSAASNPIRWRCQLAHLLKCFISSVMVVASINASAQYEVFTRVVVPSVAGPLINEFHEIDGRTQHSAEMGSEFAAFASADLATGSLKIFTSCPSRPQECGARAFLVDTLTFDLTQVAGGGLTAIDFGAKIEGTFGRFADPSFAFLIDGSTGALSAWLGYRTSQASDDVASPEELRVFGRNGSFQQFGPDYFTGKYFLRNGEVNSVRFIAELSGMTDANFRNTAFFTIDSPIPFSSGSGVFLSNPVPIPGSVYLLTSALTGLLGLRHNRRRRLPACARNGLQTEECISSTGLLAPPR